MSKRKIKLNGKVSPIDISDGLGGLPFSMNGVGGMKVTIDDELIGDNCFVEGKSSALDGKINYKHERIR